MTHFLVVTANRNGVLARIISVVSSTGINIETAAVYPIVDSGLSVVHVTINSGSELATRIERELTRLIDVIEVRRDEDHTPLSLDLGSLFSPGRMPTGEESGL